MFTKKLGVWVAAASLATSAASAQVQTRFGIKTPMRDGVKLAADMWMPAAQGKHPTLIIRTPYMKTMAMLDFPELGRHFASKGYILFVQDVRGRGDSEGSFNFFFQEGPDGYDTIEWIATQPWSNG